MSDRTFGVISTIFMIFILSIVVVGAYNDTHVKPDKQATLAKVLKKQTEINELLIKLAEKEAK